MQLTTLTVKLDKSYSFFDSVTVSNGFVVYNEFLIQVTSKICLPNFGNSAEHPVYRSAHLKLKHLESTGIKINQSEILHKRLYRTGILLQMCHIVEQFPNFLLKCLYFFYIFTIRYYWLILGLFKDIFSCIVFEILGW